MAYDFIYLLILLTAILILIENRIHRIFLYLRIQGLLLAIPVFQVHSIDDGHAWILVVSILLFKAILTPFALNWTVVHAKIGENTKPRFGYLATLIFLISGIVLAVWMTPPESLNEFPVKIHRIGLVYVILLIYLGILTFIVRSHWVPLISGFVIFENGIFLLTLVLQKGLPFGVELGAFIDALLVIVAAGALRLRQSEEAYTK